MTLKEALNRAVRNEDYEQAAKLRDKIARHGEDAEIPARMSKPIKLFTGPVASLPICRDVFAGPDKKEAARKVQPPKRRTRPMRELMEERKAAVQEELSARLAAIQDMTGERVYQWDVVRVSDMRNYYEEFMLDGVCILRVQHFDDRFFV